MRRSIVAAVLAAVAVVAPAAEAAQVQVHNGRLLVDARDPVRVDVNIFSLGGTSYSVSVNDWYHCQDCAPVAVEPGPGCRTYIRPGKVACDHVLEAEVWLSDAGSSLWSYTYVLPHTVHGGTGRDGVGIRNDASDHLELGAGDDSAGLEPQDPRVPVAGDLIDLGTGRDNLSFEHSQAAEVRAADGEHDTIDCWGSYNRVLHDQLDEVSGSCQGEAQQVDPPPPPADTTPPQVDGLTPADGATDVQVTTEVSVGFSEPMDRASAEQAFSLQRDGGAAVAGSFSWSGETLTFRPSQPLARRAAYRITVAGSATDVAGNRLSSSTTGRFQTVRR